MKTKSNYSKLFNLANDLVAKVNDEKKFNELFESLDNESKEFINSLNQSTNKLDQASRIEIEEGAYENLHSIDENFKLTQFDYLMNIILRVDDLTTKQFATYCFKLVDLLNESKH